eukprot:7280865-Prymnesium_polylepis.1
MSVLPVPGGPYSSTPVHGLARLPRRKSSGRCSGSSTCAACACAGGQRGCAVRACAGGHRGCERVSAAIVRRAPSAQRATCPPPAPTHSLPWHTWPRPPQAHCLLQRVLDSAIKQSSNQAIRESANHRLLQRVFDPATRQSSNQAIRPSGNQGVSQSPSPPARP